MHTHTYEEKCRHDSASRPFKLNFESSNMLSSTSTGRTESSSRGNETGIFAAAIMGVLSVKDRLGFRV